VIPSFSAADKNVLVTLTISAGQVRVYRQDKYGYSTSMACLARTYGPGGTNANSTSYHLIIHDF
jgi:hypothetical protein